MEFMMNNYFDVFKDELLPHEELILTEKMKEQYYFALTNYRLILKSTSSKLKIESINIKILKKVRMKKNIFGLSEIILEERNYSHGDFWNGDHGARQVVLPVLQSIDNLEYVYEEILKVQGYK